MRVYLIRHAQSASNAAAGRLALPAVEGDRLTERGWAQARAVSASLHRLGATKILSSPLRRARETAQACAEELRLPVEILDDLAEVREWHQFDELPIEEQRLRRWSVRMAEHPHDPAHSPDGAESFADVQARVRRLQAALVAGGEDRVLAVSHGILMRFFFAECLLGDDFGPGHVGRLGQLGSLNCGLCGFEYWKGVPPESEPRLDRSWRCLTWMSRPWDLGHPAPTE